MKKQLTQEMETLRGEGLSLCTGDCGFVKHLPPPGCNRYVPVPTTEWKIRSTAKNFKHMKQRREVTAKNLKHCRPEMTPELREKMRKVAIKNSGQRFSKPKSWWTDLGDWVPYALSWSKEHKELDVLKDPSASA
jgi:hypothetical protein